MVVFFVKSKENTYPKGRALMQIYRVVPITKIENRKRTDYYQICTLWKLNSFREHTYCLLLFIYIMQKT